MYNTIEYEYTVYRKSRINIKTTTSYFDDDNSFISKKISRMVVDITDNFDDLPDECFKVCSAMRKAFEDNELIEIREGIIDAEVVDKDKGETRHSEEKKKEKWYAKLAKWFRADEKKGE